MLDKRVSIRIFFSDGFDRVKIDCSARHPALLQVTDSTRYYKCKVNCIFTQHFTE